MKRNGHKLAVLAMSLLTIVSYAQNGSKSSRAPKWVTKTPEEKNTFSSVVHVQKYNADLQLDAVQNQSVFSIGTLKPVDNYADSAKYKAFYELTQKLPWGIDTESLLYELGRRNVLVPDIEKNLIELMYDAPEFVEMGSFEGESDYWCYYSITSASFQTFLKREMDEVSTEMMRLYNQGCAYRENGYPVKAAFCFVKAINIFRPFIFKCIPYRGKDLGRTVLDALLTVYDGVTIEPQYDTIPAVCGEALPFDVKVSVKQGGKALQDIVVYCKYLGESEFSSVTDGDGASSLKVTEVLPGSSVQTITFGIDDRAMFDVGNSVADKLFRCHTFPEAIVTLEPFDPVVFVNVEMSPCDSNVVKVISDSIVQIRSDMKLVTGSESADVSIKIDLKTELEDSSVYGKYSINTYSSNLSIDVVSVLDSALLKHYDILGYKYRTKGERGQESAFHSTSRQLVHLLEDVLPDFIGGIEYDKRSIVWQKYL